MDQPSLSDKVWLLNGLIASEAGILALRNGRVRFTTDRLVFDTPIKEVQAVDFPWFYFGAGCTLKINGAKYRLSFIQPGNTPGGERASIPEARRKGKCWKTALTHPDSEKQVRFRAPEQR